MVFMVSLVVFIVLSFVVGANFPVILGKAAWSYITFVYIFFAAVLPMWLLKQPRDHMTTFMFVAMIVGAVLGLIVNHPVMNLPMFTGFTNAKLGTMFPILFVTVACGAVSGFHSLVSSGTSSKTVENEKDASAAIADVMAHGVNALVVFLGNFGPETPETLLVKKFHGPAMCIAAAEGDGDMINHNVLAALGGQGNGEAVPGHGNNAQLYFRDVVHNFTLLLIHYIIYYFAFRSASCGAQNRFFYYNSRRGKSR